MTSLPSLVAPEVVVTTTSVATNDDKVGSMTAHGLPVYQHIVSQSIHYETCYSSFETDMLIRPHVSAWKSREI